MVARDDISALLHEATVSRSVTVESKCTADLASIYIYIGTIKSMFFLLDYFVFLLVSFSSALIII